MKRMLALACCWLGASSGSAAALSPPIGLISRAGDASLVLHWDPTADPAVAGYRVYKSGTSGGPFALQNSTLLASPGFCDLGVSNGQTNFYYVTAVSTSSQESAPSGTLNAVPQPFANDDAFLDYLQGTSFDYFWYLANPRNGLIPDRSASGSACSIAAVGFGLTAIGVGIDHGWISRTQGTARVLTTLTTLLNGPQGTNTSGVIGYKGWFYHFLDMNTAVRTGAELSSIDTALLLAGVLYARQYFDGNTPDETAIRSAADLIYNRVDWSWMARGTDALAMGWDPASGFTNFGNWIGYNEAMVLYLLGMGAATNPLPASAWSRWTSGYSWTTYSGISYVPFPPLFGHQYSHCWIDFRHMADSYMNGRTNTYFENSRRASLAQRQYCMANPKGQVGYSSNVWGLTACDGPSGYAARGAPGGLDDGTIAPTAAGGSIAFTPEYSIPTLRYFYSHYRPRIWTPYGFRDAFNLGAQWYGPDELGIDQGPIVIMIENYRTQRVWRVFGRNPEVQRGLQRAGFIPLASIDPGLQPIPSQGVVNLFWSGPAGRMYQVEYSTDLASWFAARTGDLIASGPTISWTDSGPPGTASLPFQTRQRFYRISQLGSP